MGSSGCGYSEWWATNGAIVRENGVIFEWRRGTGTEGIEEWRTSGEAVGWKWGGFWEESQWELGDRFLSDQREMSVSCFERSLLT